MTKCTVLGTIVLLVCACDDTRFIPKRLQMDTFTQEGRDLEDLFTQTGETKVDQFDQNGFHQIDSFSQKAAAEVDILWVVDNSASMSEEQINLGSNFDSFIAFIAESQISYHIGVISTDMEAPTHSGKLLGNPKIITNTTQNPAASFSQNVRVGITGGGNERGLLAAHEALSPELLAADNAGFLRDSASLALIFVSDEDDHSFGAVEFYARAFHIMKGIGNDRRVIVAAIVGPTPAGCTGATGAAAAGARYLSFIDQVGGTKASICSNTFSADLAELGLTVAGLARRFELSREPDWSTVEVRVNGQVVPMSPDQGWRYDPNSLTIYFDGQYVPPPQATIEVEYSNVDKAFKLGHQVNPSTLEVRVDEDGDGPAQAALREEGIDWLYDPEGNLIVFAFDYVPPLGSRIEVSYTELETEFTLSEIVENPQTLAVEVDLHDGQGFRPVLEDAANGWIYYPETNQILFKGNAVPLQGWTLRVRYSNLDWLFTLSLEPLESSLSVKQDADGDGPELQKEAPRNKDGGPAGWIYYPIASPDPYSNAISFEKTTWPATGTVITVRYTPLGSF